MLTKVITAELLGRCWYRDASNNQLLFKMHKNHCRVTSLHHCGSDIIIYFQVSLRQIWLHVHIIIRAALLQNMNDACNKTTEVLVDCDTGPKGSLSLWSRTSLYSGAVTFCHNLETDLSFKFVVWLLKCKQLVPEWQLALNYHSMVRVAIQ